MIDGVDRWDHCRSTKNILFITMAPRGIDGSMMGSRSVKPTAASKIPLVYVDIMEDKNEQLGCLPAMSCSVWTNMMFVVPVVSKFSVLYLYVGLEH